ncbi:MAG TPA: fatty acid desaturase [Anaeromyxobacteraceae bacterium]|jgi:fatty acid desaturase|nr:fatty acid desaturase [Anaeromyxobacteraceae bacterium]
MSYQPGQRKPRGSSLLRHRSDRRTLAYLAATALVLAVNWSSGRVHPVLYPLQLFLFFTAAVISHNHNHVSIWRSRAANVVTSYVIALFYGYPAVAWVPTHNQVHHKLNNRPGDSSRSPKLFRGNHLLALLVYPTLTSALQTRDIQAFLRDLWRRDRAAFWSAASEYLVFFGIMVAAFAVDWRRALLFLLIPQQAALFAIQVVNFLQHVETDSYSQWDHSRNFVSPLLNALLFNNGYHTVHHMKPGVHWSLLPALDAEHRARIDPSLRVRSLFGYLGYTYLVRPFTPGRPGRALGLAAGALPTPPPPRASS